MWDTDTLAEEASLGKDFIATITGRFPRNPPLYFKMRRDRILAKAVKTPEDYDDLAVASERLGDSLAAIKWINKKPHGGPEVEYRTHANRGTFLVHAYLKGKLGRSAAEKGLQELETAVKINPDAHFGRERVQIRLVKEFLDPSDYFEADEDKLKGAEGYAGIVRLGSGWESPDVFLAMAVDLAAYRYTRPRMGAIAALAVLRAHELESSDHKAHLNVMDQMLEGGQSQDLESNTKAEYIRLRADANAWQARRTAFMEERLKLGRHPDTDPTFWKGWVDGPRPEIHHDWILDTFGRPVAWYVLLLGLLIAGSCAAVPLTGLFLLGRAIWRWAKLRKS